MDSVDDCYDDAMCESFFATLECELIERETFADRSEARRFPEGLRDPSKGGTIHTGSTRLSTPNHQ